MFLPKTKNKNKTGYFVSMSQKPKVGSNTVQQKLFKSLKTAYLLHIQHQLSVCVCLPNATVNNYYVYVYLLLYKTLKVHCIWVFADCCEFRERCIASSAKVEWQGDNH